jgi:hypothetical protein
MTEKDSFCLIYTEVLTAKDTHEVGSIQVPVFKPALVGPCGLKPARNVQRGTGSTKHRL